MTLNAFVPNVHDNRGSSDRSQSNYSLLLQELVDTLTQSEHTQFTFSSHKKRLQTCKHFLMLWRYLLKIKETIPAKEKHFAFQLIMCLMKRQEFDPIVHQKYGRLEGQSNSARFFAAWRSRGVSSGNSGSGRRGDLDEDNAQIVNTGAANARSSGTSGSSTSDSRQMTDVMREYKSLCQQTLLDVLDRLRKRKDGMHQELYAFCAGVLAVSMFRLVNPNNRQSRGKAIKLSTACEPSDNNLDSFDSRNSKKNGSSETDFDAQQKPFSKNNGVDETEAISSIVHDESRITSYVDRFINSFQKKMMRFPHLRWIYEEMDIATVVSQEQSILCMDIEERVASFVEEQLLLPTESSSSTSSTCFLEDHHHHSSKHQRRKQFFHQLFRYYHHLHRDSTDDEATVINRNAPPTPSLQQQQFDYVNSQLRQRMQDMFCSQHGAMEPFTWIPDFAESSEFFYVFICEYVCQVRALLSTHLDLHFSSVPHYRTLIICYIQSLQNFDPKFHVNEKTYRIEDSNYRRFYNPMRYMSMYKSQMQGRYTEESIGPSTQPPTSPRKRDSGTSNISKPGLSKAAVLRRKTIQRQRMWSYDAQQKWITASFTMLKTNPQFINLLLSLLIPSTKTYALHSEVLPLLEYMDLWFREYKNSHIDVLQQRFQHQHETERMQYQHRLQGQMSGQVTGSTSSRILNMLISPLQSTNTMTGPSRGSGIVTGGGIPMPAMRRTDIIYETSIYLPAVGFPLDLFTDMIDQLIETNHFQTTVRTLILIYNIIDLFGTRRERVKLIHECLLKKHFWNLFLHWNEDTRVCFHRILIYKVKRYTPPPQLMDIQMRLQQKHVLMLKNRRRQRERITSIRPSDTGDLGGKTHPSRTGRLSVLTNLKRGKQIEISTTATLNHSISSSDLAAVAEKQQIVPRSKSLDDLPRSAYGDGYDTDEDYLSTLSDSDIPIRHQKSNDTMSSDLAHGIPRRTNNILPPELVAHASNAISSGTSPEDDFSDDFSSLAAEEALDLVLKSKADSFVQVVFITPPTVDMEQEKLKKSQLRQVSTAQDEYNSRSQIVKQKQTKSLVAKSEMNKAIAQTSIRRQQQQQTRNDYPRGNSTSHNNTEEEDDEDVNTIVHIPHEMTIPHDLRVYIPQAKRAYKSVLQEYQQWKQQIDQYFISHAHDIQTCEMLLIDIPYPTIHFPRWDLKSDYT